MSRIDLCKLFPIRRPRLPGGRWLIALFILAVLLGSFWACGVFSQDAASAPDASYGPAIFFSVIIAYIVPVFGYISQRTMAAIDLLSPTLEVEPAVVEGWRRRVYQKPLRWCVIVTTIGLMSGIGHNLLLYASPAALVAQISSSLAAASVAAGTLLIWLVFTTVLAALLDNALLLNRLARRARVQLFDSRSLQPFATVAVISTLAIIGAQAAFPIMTIEGGMEPLAFIPGLLATGIPLLLLAALPVWPVHRRLRDHKRAILADLDRRIRVLPLPDPEQPESFEPLVPLLAYRREVAQAPEWPFDVGVLARLGLYLIIPPLTWVGAALIENVVDALL